MSEKLLEHFYDWFEYEAWAFFKSEATFSRMTAHPRLDPLVQGLINDHVDWYRAIIGPEALPDLPLDSCDGLQYVLAAWGDFICEADLEHIVSGKSKEGNAADMPVADVAMHLLTQSAFIRGKLTAYAIDMGLETPDTSLAEWRAECANPKLARPSTRKIRIDGR